LAAGERGQKKERVQLPFAEGGEKKGEKNKGEVDEDSAGPTKRRFANRGGASTPRGPSFKGGGKVERED